MRFWRHALDPVKYLIGINKDRSIVCCRHGLTWPLPTLGIIGKRPAGVCAKPRNTGCDRDTVVIKQAGVKHRYKQPLRHALTIGTTKFRHIRMNRQLLPGRKNIGIDNCRNNECSASHFARYAQQIRVCKKGFYTRCLDIGPVGIGLTKIVRALGCSPHIVAISQAINTVLNVIKCRIKTLG